MKDKQKYIRMADQLGIVVDRAREYFTDSLEEVLDKKGIELDLTDKSGIENLFSDAVHTYICAELTAFIGYLLYDELKEDDILERILPGFLDEYEAMIENVPERLEKKANDIFSISKRVLESDKEKNLIVEKLLRDIKNVAEVKKLRASFDAVTLSMMGE